MAQESQNILPKYLNLDSAYESLGSDESPYIRDLSDELNANPDLGIGTDNTTGEGQNTTVLTPTRANVAIPDVLLPEGINKNVGTFESKTTQDLIICNHNSNNQFGIYLYGGNTGVFQKVIIDPELLFSDDPTAFMAEHRFTLRTRTNELGQVIEKYLLITDGNTYHKWIDVIAAIKTDGFNSQLHPYFALQPPHFDRQELLAWAVRSPMIAPRINLLPNTVAQIGKPNELLGTAFEFCYEFVQTDGRVSSIVSPFSLPAIIKKEDFLSNPDLIPKRVQLELYAGSCKVEKVNVYVRTTAKKSESNIGNTFGDWLLYDTIYKYTSSGANSPLIIGDDYWLRTGAWSAYSYDPVQNTIKYIFDNTKLALIVDSQDRFSRLGNDMPQLSVALSDLGDAVQLGYNRYGFDNLDDSVIEKLSASVIPKAASTCVRPLRTLKLYVYAGRERGNESCSDCDDVRGIWHSQVGYVVGEDTNEIWGGLFLDGESRAIFNYTESQRLGLNFADKKGFRCYLKGTPYYSDCEWYVANQDFTLTKIPFTINSSNTSDVNYVNDVLDNYGFFVGMFTFQVPTGRYIATLGRHSVPSSGDYRNKSTYIMGLANSRLASIKSYTDGGDWVSVNTVALDGIVSVEKEIELDCTTGDIDLWGNGQDLFYVMAPFIGEFNGHATWQFVEGYLYESKSNRIPIERFPYVLFYDDGGDLQYYNTGSGTYTDKNGHFFIMTWGSSNQNQFRSDLLFTIKKDCTYPFTFLANLVDSATWKYDLEFFFDSYNSGVVGNANRVIVNGSVKDLTNSFGYSNIAVSIVGGETAYTNENGDFTLIVHNGLNNLRVNNIYINAAGNFTISVTNCGFLPLLNYDESLSPCTTLQPRHYPFISLNIDAQTNESTTLKSGSNKVIGLVCADIAGRVSFVNKFAENYISTYQERNSISSVQMQWMLSGLLQLNNNPQTADIKWAAFFIGNNSKYKKYLQWVGGGIEYINSNGIVVSDQSTASLVRINITSILNTNIQNNFTLLSNYQFERGDRLVVLDNGSGVLLNPATFGQLIDVEIQGTNYNDSAVKASLIPPSENTVLPATTDTAGQVFIYAKYDSRFDMLKDKSGFWIEIYSVNRITEKFPYYQVGSFFPVINGEIAEYVSGGVTAPVYNFPTQGLLNYWDTYLINRNIIGISQFITHPFESPNITDTWGVNAISGGKTNTVNTNAQRLWYNDNIIKSNDYITNGIINGLSMFLSANKKDFKGYQRGGIVAIFTQYSLIMYICENDWFITDYNFQYIYANAQGVQVANLDNNLSVPHQKIGQQFGCRLQDTSSFVSFDEFVWWIDVKNQSAVLCNYSAATDVSDIIVKGEDGNSKSLGIKSYLYKKLDTIERWNSLNQISKRFDIVCGVDEIRRNIYVTFRPRRSNSNNVLSYTNRRRNVDLEQQETVVFSIDKKRWVRFNGFTPEAYGKVRGNITGIEFVSFAAGKPYLQNKAANLFTNFFGQQLEPCLIIVPNKSEDVVKILQSMSLDINNTSMYSDLIYSTQAYGYSYLPLSLFKEQEKMFYAAFLRDMVSYLQDPVNGDFRSTLEDGKRLFGEYFLIRLVHEYSNLGKYFELNKTSVLYISSVPVKPPAV